MPIHNISSNIIRNQYVINIEIETKIKTNNLEEIKAKLIKLGATFSQEIEQIDEYFKLKEKDLKVQKPGSFIIRIRSQKDKYFLTYKELTARTGVWIEHDLEISNPNELRSILKKIDFTKILTITKNRIKGKLDDFEICLDKIKELGNYIEFELISENAEQAKQKIDNLIKKLGATEKDIEHRGYVEIIFQNMGIKSEGINR